MNLASTASNQGIADDSRQLRSQLEAKMTQPDIAIAQQRASEWKPVPMGADEPTLEELAQLQPVQLPIVGPSIADQLNSQEAKLRLKELGVLVNRDTFFEAVKADNLGVFKLFHTRR